MKSQEAPSGKEPNSCWAGLEFLSLKDLAASLLLDGQWANMRAGILLQHKKGDYRCELSFI